jgi:integrase
MRNPPVTKRWIATSTQFLIRDSISGRYYARFWQDRKPVWLSLKTTKISVAKARLAEKLKTHKERQGASRSIENGTGTVEQLAKLYLSGVKVQVDIKDSTAHYYEQIVTSLLATWPELKDTSPKDVSKGDCESWAKKYSTTYSPTRYNNAVDVLRKIFEVAIAAGSIYKNPAADLGKRTPNKKRLELPTKEEFSKLVDSIASQGAWCSRQCADLVSFLAFSGCRLDEARNVRWTDVGDEFLWVHGGQAGTKNMESRYVPIIPQLKELLSDMKAKPRYFKGDRSGYVLAVTECQRALDKACRLVGIKRLTHHDLRHLFTTRCIQSGVDIPTVAKWLGHKDGGALLMRTYSHLLQEHSKAMAAKVLF